LERGKLTCEGITSLLIT